MGELGATLAGLLFENQCDGVVVVVVNDLSAGQSSQGADALAVGQLLDGGGVGVVHGAFDLDPFNMHHLSRGVNPYSFSFNRSIDIAASSAASSASVGSSNTLCMS